MGKNVAVFVDVANIFYAAKAAGVDIDYVTLLKAGSAGRDLVRAYAYTGLDPENENQRNFHDFLRRNGYKVVSKDIRKYGDGKVKANLDIELVVDMMKTARNLDVAIVVSGDGDFAPAIRAVQEMGVRVEVVSFRGNTSSDLMDVADQFTDIVQIAKVEKGSSRSGRRVAGDEEDLSMTEVPEKQSEGTGERTRGRGGRIRRGTAEPVSTGSRGRGRTSVAAAAAVPSEEHGEGGALIALPGEKLSRAAASRVAAVAPAADLDEDEELDGAEAPDGGEGEGFGDDAPRRRRRRGGRGRGRSRGREENGYAEARSGEGEAAAAGEPDEAEADEDEERPVPARRVASAFGSVWDSQIGSPAPRSTPSRPAPVDDEDFDEPAVPEYLLTERRQRDAGRGGGNRGGRGGRGGAYAAALERERFGGGRGTPASRFAEPQRSRDSFGRNDRNDRNDRGGRGDRGFRPAPAPAPRGTSDEPWSEVPPELEAMLRAQMGSRAQAPRREPAAAAAPVTEAAETAAPARRGRRTTAAAAEATEAPAEATTAPRSTTRRTKATADAGAGVPTEAAPAKTARTRTTRAKAAEAEASAPASAPATTAKRTTRSKAAASDAAPIASATDEAAAPKRRTTRKKADTAG